MDHFHEHPCFNFDHKSNGSKNKIKKLNKDVNSLFHSSKIRMINILLNRFRAFRYKNYNKIEQLTRDASQNGGGNIRRIEYPGCDALFEQLKNSTNAEEVAFMTEFVRAIALTNSYKVKGYLTWSSSHRLYPSSITTFNTDERILRRGNIGCPHKICFFLIRSEL